MVTVTRHPSMIQRDCAIVQEWTGGRPARGITTTRALDILAAGAIILTLIVTGMAFVGTIGPPTGFGVDLDVVRVAFASVLVTSCLIGMVIASRPWDRAVRGSQMSEEDGYEPPGDGEPIGPSIVAHHPDCGRFEEHTIMIGERSWCAGCVGLFLGSLMGLPVAGLLAFDALPEGQGGRMVVATFGAVFVVLGVGEERFKPWDVLTHVAVTGLLVLGTIILASMLMDSGLIPGFSSIVYAFSILAIRMEISKLRHSEICLRCIDGCSLEISVPSQARLDLGSISQKAPNPSSSGHGPKTQAGHDSQKP